METLEQPGSKPERPIWMAMASVNKPKLKDVILVTLVSVAPVAIAILMQKPALRQQLQMKFYNTSLRVSQNTAFAFGKMAMWAEEGYRKAQL